MQIYIMPQFSMIRPDLNIHFFSACVLCNNFFNKYRYFFY